MGGSVEALLREQRPRVLNGFRCSSPTIETTDHVVAGAFELFCAKCNGGAFRAFEVSTRWSGQDGAPQDSVTGLTLACRACGDSVELFDAVRDGYDGEHRHLKFMNGPRVQAALQKDGVELGDLRLRAWFTFNVALDELAESAGELGISPIDLFDWFSVEARTSEGDPWDWVWECECA